MGKRILITGGTGLIGTELTKLLLDNGCEVVHLSRSSRNSIVKTFTWDVKTQTIEAGALDNVDVIIHLAGANVGEGRWTDKRKKEILESRIKSTQLLGSTLQSTQHKVTTIISASAIGYYGFEDQKKVFTEDDSPGDDFLATVTRKWEEAVDKFSALGLRVVKLRIGVVLAKGQGALDPISKAVRLNVGAPLGSGEQWMSWVHVDDVCKAFVFALEHDEIKGAYNLAAPEATTNKQLTTEVANALKKPLVLPKVPAFGLRLLFGEMADIILKGSRVSSEKLISAGFQYRFSKVSAAVQNLLID